MEYVVLFKFILLVMIMSGKRFIEPYKDCRVIKNIHTGETATYYDTEDGLMFLKWLNNLFDNNEELYEEIKDLNEVLARMEEENMELRKRVMIFQDKIKGLMK